VSSVGSFFSYINDARSHEPEVNMSHLSYYLEYFLKTSVSQPLLDRGPVNSFFIRRGPGSHKFPHFFKVQTLNQHKY